MGLDFGKVKALMAARRIDRRRYVLSALLALVGMVLFAGGIQLITLGGSIYYALAGLAVLASAYWICRGDRRGVWLYAALLAITFVWSLWEGGVDFWALQARMLAPLVLGAWVCWPLIRRSLRVSGAAILALIALMALCLTATLRTRQFPFPDRLTGDRAAVARAGDDTAKPIEWLHYGNDLAGSRFSSASQITPANVAGLKPAWTYRTGVFGAETGLGRADESRGTARAPRGRARRFPVPHAALFRRHAVIRRYQIVRAVDVGGDAARPDVVPDQVPGGSL